MCKVARDRGIGDISVYEHETSKLTRPVLWHQVVVLDDFNSGQKQYPVGNTSQLKTFMRLNITISRFRFEEGAHVFHMKRFNTFVGSMFGLSSQYKTQ